MQPWTQPLNLLALLSFGLLTTACAPDAEDAEGTIAVQISGEAAATAGLGFPTGSEVTLADGWELHFSHVLVTIANVTLSENPDRSPSDQSETGTVVARERGPFAVDLHVEGDVPAAGGEGTATSLFSFAAQTEGGHEPFALDRRYAFGYEIVTADAAAVAVNFAGDTETEAAYAMMQEQGYAVLYVGTATFRGEDCATSDLAYDFDALPREVPFALGFATPTAYVNCQNQENQGDAFDDEEYQRGIAVLANRAATAQITLHVEHPFFSDVEHDPLVYFDQMAARLVGADAKATLTTEHFTGVDPTALTDANGAGLPYRSCDGTSLPAGKQRAFGTGTTPINPTASPATALRDYRDYVEYVQSTQGHLNGGEGLCFVDRRYPSPR